MANDEVTCHTHKITLNSKRTYLFMIFGASAMMDCARHGMKMSNETGVAGIEQAVFSNESIVTSADLLLKWLWCRNFGNLPFR